MTLGKREIGKEFDTWSEGYSARMNRIVPFYRELLDELFDRLPPHLEVKKVLDLGAGSGNIIAKSSKSFPDAHYIAVDASAEMLSQIENRFPDLNLQLEQELMQNVKVAPGSVDLVTASFSMHHLSSNEKTTVIRNARKWLRKGGSFLYSDLMVEEGSSEHKELIERWRNFVMKHSDQEEWEWLIDHHLTYDRVESENQLVQKFMDAGFSFSQCHRHDRNWVAMIVQ